MLTLQDLKDMEPDTIFASGMVSDNEKGVNMDNSGKLLRWVAVRGGIEDWAIYCGPEDWSEERVASNGNKVHNEKNIKRLILCDDEAFKMYRH